MKKLLLSILFLTPLAYSKVNVIDYDADTKIRTYCINGFVFTQYDKTALVQVMSETYRRDGGGTVLLPMGCINK